MFGQFNFFSYICGRIKKTLLYYDFETENP